MAEKALNVPLVDSATTETDLNEPQDLIVRTSTRTPESHLSRSHRHETVADDWTEAEQVVRSDMAKNRKPAT
jgi:hypothetical protein